MKPKRKTTLKKKVKKKRAPKKWTIEDYAFGRDPRHPALATY